MDTFNGPLGRELIERDISAMSEAEWQEYRTGLRSSFGCSAVPALMSMCPYGTPRDAVARVRGMVSSSGGERAVMGKAMEAAIQSHVATVTGRAVLSYPYTLRHPHLPQLHAHLDGVVGGDQSRVGLEIKFTNHTHLDCARWVEQTGEWGAIQGSKLYRDWVQCQAQMSVCDTQTWLLAFVAGDGDSLKLLLNHVYDLDLSVSGFFLFEIERDEAFIATLERRVQRVWHWYVEPGEQGLPPMERATDLDVLRKSWPPQVQTVERPDLLADVATIKALKAQIDDLTGQYDLMRSALLERIGRFGTFIVGDHKIHHKPTKRGIYTRGI